MELRWTASRDRASRRARRWSSAAWAVLGLLALCAVCCSERVYARARRYRFAGGRNGRVKERKVNSETDEKRCSEFFL